MPGTLLPRQRKFVQHYLRTLNATESYKLAGYSAQEPVARINASRLLTNANVKAAIERVLGKQVKQLEVSADRVLQESARLAFFDVRQLYTDDGSLKPVSEWPDEVAAAVSGIESIERIDADGIPVGVTKKVHLWSKPSQLTLLAKHLRLLQDEKQPQTVVNVNVLVQSLSGALSRAYSDNGSADIPKLPQ